MSGACLFNLIYLHLLYYTFKESIKYLFQGESGSTIEFLIKKEVRRNICFLSNKEFLELYNEFVNYSTE